MILITVRDGDTGHREEIDFMDDYVITTAGTCYVANIQTYPKTGTHVITVKGRKEGPTRQGPARGLTTAGVGTGRREKEPEVCVKCGVMRDRQGTLVHRGGRRNE